MLSKKISFKINLKKKITSQVEALQQRDGLQNLGFNKKDIPDKYFFLLEQKQFDGVKQLSKVAIVKYLHYFIGGKLISHRPSFQ